MDGGLGGPRASKGAKKRSGRLPLRIYLFFDGFLEGTCFLAGVSREAKRAVFGPPFLRQAHVHRWMHVSFGPFFLPVVFKRNKTDTFTDDCLRVRMPQNLGAQPHAETGVDIHDIYIYIYMYIYTYIYICRYVCVHMHAYVDPSRSCCPHTSCACGFRMYCPLPIVVCIMYCIRGTRHKFWCLFVRFFLLALNVFYY